MTDDPIVTFREACTVFCVPGVRFFCAANGLDFKTFVQDGYRESVLRATGDAAVIAAIDEARNGRK